MNRKTYICTDRARNTTVPGSVRCKNNKQTSSTSSVCVYQCTCSFRKWIKEIFKSSFLQWDKNSQNRKAHNERKYAKLHIALKILITIHQESGSNKRGTILADRQLDRITQWLRPIGEEIRGISRMSCVYRFFRLRTDFNDYFDLV